MPKRRLKLLADFSRRVMDLLEFAEQNELPATLRTRLEGLIIETSRLEIEMRERLTRAEAAGEGR